ncbi:MAG TPA: KpsF/GutQ family sugar-phosphate isomerase [Thermoanaerobaculia bacterium]|jgi:arabinose-5-phosphate isomerase|nr:KpsF/GutQ family sugar-phosphate isomerase [Thermoanaerobaculia bacterium]
MTVPGVPRRPGPPRPPKPARRPRLPKPVRPSHGEPGTPSQRQGQAAATALPALPARSPRQVAVEVLETEAAAIRALVPQLDDAFDRAVALLAAVSGRVVCTGMGKSGLIMKKVAATLSSTGTPALFLHPAEAVHGDLGMIVPGDVVLAASASGTTEELLRLVATLRRLGVPLLAMTGSPGSPLARHADLHLSVAIDREACPLNLAPTASTTAMLALGDALAMALSEARGFTREDFALLHPAGHLGKRLLKVEQLMHEGPDLPRVAMDTSMRDAIYEMSKKKLGITAVTRSAADQRLAGCISDGDLRRLLASDDGLLRRTAGECMNSHPRTIAGGELAAAALKMMEDHRITSLFICDAGGRLAGIVHLHDLWGLELF